jgi:P-type conjugative transfer protein TrbJ
MKKLRRPLLACVILFFLLPLVLVPLVPSASAGILVLDISNLAQNIINVLSQYWQQATQANQLVKQTQQAINQVRQLYNLQLQLETMYRNLVALRLVLNDPSYSLINKCQALLWQGQGLAFSVRHFNTAFDDLYRKYGSKAVTTHALTDERRRWSEQTRASVVTAMQVQASVEDIPSDRQDLSRAVEASRAADGSLAAQQATTEVAALNAKQLMRMEAMIAANGRADAARMAEERQRKEAALAYHKHLMRSWDQKSNVAPRTSFQ